VKLFAWQERAVRDSDLKEGWGLFARPGTGKTLAALTIAQRAQLLPVVVCPKAVKSQWAANGVEHIFHYEQLRNVARFKVIAELLRANDCCLILDESHRISNPSTKTSKAALKLAPLAKKRLCLTGTPSANSPADLWAQLRFLRPTDKLETRREWQDRYIDSLSPQHPLMRHLRGNPFIAKKNRDGSLVLKNIDELSRRVAEYGTSIHDDEMQDLPDRTFVIRHCTPDQDLARTYDELRRLCVTDIQGSPLTAENAAVLATRLLRLASGLGASDMTEKMNNPKLSQLMDDLPDFTSEGRVIIWSVWTSERAELCQALEAMHVSWTDDVEKFLSVDDIRVLVGSPKKIGAGLNLQAATYQLWLSRTWSLIEHEQALHRNYRVGQTKKTTVVDYVTEGTIDLAVMRALDAKHNLLSYIMKGMIE
jgi:SNF2 family DNA or RNA helicase